MKNNFFGRLIKELRSKYIYKSVVDKKSYISTGCTVYCSNISKYSYLGFDTSVVYAEIGKFCSIADNVKIGAASHPMDWVSTSPVFCKGRNCLRKNFSNEEFNPYITTKIGNDVWIGQAALIKSGVNIGDGAIIGMGSVVTKDIPPYEIWAGNPARLIRKRFDDEIINELLNISWWDHDEIWIESHCTLFTKPEEFVLSLKQK